MEDTVRDLLADHERRFDDAVESGDFGPLLELFAVDAELAFVNVPAGPFRGREAIAAAYATQPPDDALDVLSVEETADGTIVERFAWRRGGGGTMTFTLAGEKIARLVVAFD